jgi:hypothetical protein
MPSGSALFAALREPFPLPLCLAKTPRTPRQSRESPQGMKHSSHACQPVEPEPQIQLSPRRGRHKMRHRFSKDYPSHHLHHETAASQLIPPRLRTTLGVHRSGVAAPNVLAFPRNCSYEGWFEDVLTAINSCSKVPTYVITWSVVGCKTRLGNVAGRKRFFNWRGCPGGFWLCVVTSSRAEDYVRGRIEAQPWRGICENEMRARHRAVGRRRNQR